MRTMYTIYISRRGQFVIVLGGEEKRQFFFSWETIIILLKHVLESNLCLCFQQTVQSHYEEQAVCIEALHTHHYADRTICQRTNMVRTIYQSAINTIQC